MHDIQMVFERWGVWAANNHRDVTWSSIAADFKGLIPSRVRPRPQCCDDDAMIICGCMARLKKNNSDLHDLLVDYYVCGMTFTSLTSKHCCSDGYIRKGLQKAEGIAEGMLMALDIRLDMGIVANDSNWYTVVYQKLLKMGRGNAPRIKDNIWQKVYIVGSKVVFLKEVA